MPHESGFGVQQRTTFRVLELDEDNHYRSRLFVMIDGEPVEYETVYPSKDGGFLDYIPFIILGPSAVSPEIQKAPIQDVIDANISHYQTSADFEFSLFWSASPTAVITGLMSEIMRTPITLAEVHYGSFPPERRHSTWNFADKVSTRLQERCKQSKCSWRALAQVS